VKLILAPAVLLIVALAGCAGSPAAEPSATPTPATSATPTPSATSTPEPSSFTVDGVGWSIHGLDLDSSGMWASADGAPTTDPDLAGPLSALLGVDPTVSVEPGNPHRPDYTVYTWPGLVLGVSTHQKDDFHWNPYVVFTAPSSGTTDLRTTAGFTVGANQGADAAAVAVASEIDGDGNTVYYVEPDQEVPPGSSDGAWNTVLVIVDADGTVLKIVTPVVWGDNQL